MEKTALLLLSTVSDALSTHYGIDLFTDRERTEITNRLRDLLALDNVSDKDSIDDVLEPALVTLARDLHRFATKKNLNDLTPELQAIMKDVRAQRLEQQLEELRQENKAVMDEIESLKDAERMLDALEIAGVDNWGGYSYAMAIYTGEEEY